MVKIFYKKEASKIVMLVIFSLISTCLFLEATFRIVYPIKFQIFINHSTKSWVDSDNILNTKVARSSKTLGYEWIANSEHNWVKINSLGMLDRERSRYKSKDVYRIICLGDSTTANAEYVKMLEELLNRNIKKKRFEVWNCGVTGYNAIQYCRALQEKWLKYEPDMVIIGFCLNDFVATPLVVKEQNKLVGYFPHKEISSAVNPILLKHSALYRFIVMRMFFSKTNNYFEETVETTSLYLQKTKELLTVKNMRFLIVILGLTEPLENYKQSWGIGYVQIKKIIDEHHIESLDMGPIFKNNDPKSLRLNDELHFNEKGSQIVAKAIYDYIQQNVDKLGYSQ